MIYCKHLIGDIITYIKGGDHMTDSKKLDLILSEMQNMKSDMQNMKSDMQDMKSDMQGMKGEIQTLNQKVTGLEKDMVDVKADLRRLHRDADFILDEVERVHDILDSHKKDRTVHTA